MYVALRLNGLDVPIDRDEGMFGYIGQVILDGGLPYRDVLEHKPPVGFYIYALALSVVPATATGIHAFLHVYNFATLVVLYFAASIGTGSRVVGLWVAFAYAVLSSSPSIQGFTASTEMFLLLPLSLSLLCVASCVAKDSLLLSCASGFFGALAFFTKQTAGVVLAFVGLYLLCSVIARVVREEFAVQRALASLAGWLAGFGIVVVFFVGFFAWHGVLGEFYYWSLTHSLIYTDRISGWRNLTRATTMALEIWRGHFALIGLGLVSSGVACARRRPIGLVMSGLFLASMLAPLPGTVYRHYFAQIAPGIAIVGGWGAAFCLGRISQPRLRHGAAVLVAGAILIVPVWVDSDYYITDSGAEISRTYFSGNPFPESEALARFIAQRTTEDDTVYIYGSEAQILLLSERRSSTSFALIYPLMSEYPRYQEFQHRAWDEVERARPRYILVVQLPASFLWDGKADRWIEGKTRALVEQDYDLEAAVTTAHPKGELRVFEPGGSLPTPSAQRRLPILVFRRQSEM